MSYTEIYKFGKDGKAQFLGETKNAFRGAMCVWNVLDEKYLPPYIPEWSIKLGEDISDKRYHRSGSMSPEPLKEIWALFSDSNVSFEDKVVLGSTFDKVIVRKEDLPELIKAYKSFADFSSLPEQAELIEKAFEEDDDLIAIGFNQTSVNGDTWLNAGGYDENDEGIPYNILEQDSHWNLFSDIEG